MSEEKNKAATRRYWQEVFNRGDLVVVDDVITADFVLHEPAFLDPTHGRTGCFQASGR